VITGGLVVLGTIVLVTFKA